MLFGHTGPVVQLKIGTDGGDPVTPYLHFRTGRLRGGSVGPTCSPTN